MMKKAFLNNQTDQKRRRGFSRVAVTLACLLFLQTALLLLVPLDSAQPPHSWENMLPSPGVLPGTPAVSHTEQRPSSSFEGLLCSLCAFPNAPTHLLRVDYSPSFSTAGRTTLHRLTRRLLI